MLSKEREQRRGDLYELLGGHPDGLTVGDMELALGLDRVQVRQTLNDASVTVFKSGEHWMWKQADEDEIREWQQRRQT